MKTPMKKYLLPALFCFAGAFAQDELTDVSHIAEAEMKSAASLMEVEVNPDTQNYDVTYHKLEFTVDPAVYSISGTVTTTFTALSAMTTVTFDLTSELTVSSVTKNNVSLTFVQSGDELVITLPGGLAADTSATVVITYSGAPAEGEEAFTTSTHGANIPVLYTLSEPFGARDWWPCKQDLNDKADSIDVYITAPSAYTSVANGVQQEIVTNLGGTKTTHFHHGHPIAAYLIAIAVTNYSVYTQTAGTAPNTFPLVNYVYPENLATAQIQLAQTPLIMDFYEDTFETYPYADEKYGHAQFGWGGGMEHTTVSFMYNFSRQLIAHELGHQWFGDKVTCGTWQDIWLNEGFATYMASMVIADFDGATAFISDKSSMIQNIISQPGGSVYIPANEVNSVNRIFSSRLSYNKGAMVLNMLRFKLGDTLFFQALQAYLDDPALAYGYATTPNLQAHLETAYGSSLSEFFQDWVYNQGYPSYTIVAHNSAVGQVQFTVNQTQSHSSVAFFEMPVPVRVFGSAGQWADLVLDNTFNGQVIYKSVPFTVTSVGFDPNKELISGGNSITLDTNDFEVAGLSLFPNPSASQLQLNVPEGVSITETVFYNMLGQAVKRTSSNTNWDVSMLSHGVYILAVKSSKGLSKLRFIKQ